MADILELIKAAVTQVATNDDRPLAEASLEALEAGAGLNPKDMSPEERRKRKQRQNDNDRRSRAARRDREVRLHSYVDKPKTETVKPSILTDVYKRVIVPMRHVIEDTVRAKANRISRHIGPLEVEDVVSDAMERIAIAFAKYEHISVDDMVPVAKDMRDRKSLPRDLDGVAQIMAQTINIQAKKATSQWWRDNPTLSSIEYLGTLERNSAGKDEVVANAAANGDLKIVGWRPPRPGGVDSAVVAHILHGIMTDRRLHDVADIIMGLDEDEEGNLEHRLNTDGTFPWYRYSKPIWLACGLEEAVYKQIPKAKRAAAARKAVENRFTIVQQVMERAYALLTEYEDGISNLFHQTIVPVEIEHEPVAQAPTDKEEVMAALLELLKA